MPVVPERYFDPRMLSRLEGLDFRPRRPVDGWWAGDQPSRGVGAAIEFLEHRAYAPGDDLRRVDWKVFGRTDKLYVRQHESQRAVRATFLIDASGSMAFRGSGTGDSKYDYAARLGLALAWLVRHRGGSVALGLLGRAETWLPWAASSQQLVMMSQMLADHAPPVQPGGDNGTTIGDSLAALAPRLTSPALVVIASDLFDEPSHLNQSLARLAAQRQELVLLHVCDRQEIEFPFQNVVHLESLERAMPSRTVDAARIANAYRTQVRQFLAARRAWCERQSIDYVPIMTDEPVGDVLAGYLIARNHLIRSPV
jgi:uncharacterized protein (DUF58 family)